MELRFHTIVTLAMAALMTSGCSLRLFGRNDPPPPPAPLTVAPAGTVTGSALPPPDSAGTTTGATTATTPEAPTGLAALDPSANAVPAPAATTSGELGRTDLLGGWTMAAAGESCQLFMTLTTWAGGYRASTRGCTNASLQGISAWNIEAGQVQLFNDAGSTVARLYPTSKSQLDGQSTGGGPVTLTR